MELKSAAFQQNQMIPKKYTCQGQDINPPLQIQDIPDQTKSLALIVDDPDAPNGDFVHWVVYNIPVIEVIPENATPGKAGMNDFGKQDYGGPCPPIGTHRYFFRLYALNEKLTAEEGADRDTLLKRMEGHILDQAELMGFYMKQ
ncbi:YbhB/YbcL family Raf kinase inhibitor-like protein [bacterium]|nr:YbhB/YbcL family Raf kinase inhibitor-like protein [bacterium]